MQRMQNCNTLQHLEERQVTTNCLFFTPRSEAMPALDTDHEKMRTITQLTLHLTEQQRRLEQKDSHLTVKWWVFKLIRRAMGLFCRCCCFTCILKQRLLNHLSWILLTCFYARGFCSWPLLFFKVSSELWHHDVLLVYILENKQGDLSCRQWMWQGDTLLGHYLIYDAATQDCWLLNLLRKNFWMHSLTNQLWGQCAQILKTIAGIKTATGK